MFGSAPAVWDFSTITVLFVHGPIFPPTVRRQAKGCIDYGQSGNDGSDGQDVLEMINNLDIRRVRQILAEFVLDFCSNWFAQ